MAKRVESDVALTRKTPQRYPWGERRVPDSGGRTCGDCAHLWVKSHTGGRWFKCDVTPYAYDMRKWWPACDRFTEVSGDA